MANTQRDPVMQVDELTAAGRSEYQGQTYYFCSQTCKNRFDQNPQQYAKQGAQGAGKSGSARLVCCWFIGRFAFPESLTMLAEHTVFGFLRENHLQGRHL